MAEVDAALSRIMICLKDNGLACFGRFAIEPGETADPAFHHLEGRPALLFGNAGSAMWQHFSASGEYRDGRPDPMNRWTRRIVGDAVAPLSQTGKPPPECLFPFGERVWPFQRWAKRTMGLQSSPLGMLIHPEYGLWFALRAAIVLPAEVTVGGVVPEVQTGAHPCDTCDGRPCLSACPVGAYGEEGFNTAACRGHLASGNRPDCMTQGCAARDACPVGRKWRYEEAQLQFHMVAFGG